MLLWRWGKSVAWFALAAFSALALAISYYLGQQHGQSSNGVESALRLDAVDIGYMQWMAMHHDQAIALARLALHKGEPRLSGLAMKILGNQLLEVGQMRALLELAEQPLLPTNKQMTWMEEIDDPAFSIYLSICSSSPGGMQGLYTSRELQRLRDLRDEAFEEQFLRMMIDHHKGGLPMSAFAREHAYHPYVVALATKILREQQVEIGEMTKLLRASLRTTHGS